MEKNFENFCDPRFRPAESLWRNADFLKLWAGQAVSEAGSRITREGLPLTAVMLLGATPAEMGVLSALGSVSLLLFGLIAGVWVDRLPRKPILITMDVGRAVLLGTIPLAALYHVLGMTQIYAVAALASVLTVFFDVAYQSYLPSLVPAAQLAEGNQKLVTSSTTAELVGPALAGVLVQALTAPVAILFDSISFLVSAGSVALIGEHGMPPPRLEKPPSVWHETMVGIRFIAGNAALRAIALHGATGWYFAGFFGSTYVLFAIQTLGLKPAQLGVVIAVGGAAATLGSFVTGRVTKRLGLGPALILSNVVWGLALFFIPLAHGPAPLAMFLLACGQFLGDSSGTIGFINAVTLRQRLAPAEFLGRVNAAMQISTRGMGALGAVTGGVVATAVGVRPTMWFAAGAANLAWIWLVRPDVWRLRE